MKVIAFGEVLWDIYPDKRAIGGAPLNFAAHLALMGDEVSLITGVGRDALGKETIEAIKSYGIRDELIAVTDRQTGQCIVSLDEDGIPCYNVAEDTAYDNIVLSEDMLERIKTGGADLFYFNTLGQRNSVSRETLKRLLSLRCCEKVMCDLNIRKGCYDRDSVVRCLSCSDIVKISREESCFLYEVGAIKNVDKPIDEALREEYPNIELLVYTMGEDGSIVYAFSRGETHYSEKPEKVEAVSTVGAGDCYGAAFIHYYMSGSTIDEAMRYAGKRCCIVVSHTEAVPDCLRDLHI